MNLQELIDSNSVIHIKKGVYETLPIFIPSNKTIYFENFVNIRKFFIHISGTTLPIIVPS